MTSVNKEKGCTIWFTGLACSGKTTIANITKELIEEKGKSIVILDSDELRSTVSKDLGYTRKDRDTHMKLVANICHLLTLQGELNLAAVISPTRKVRDNAKEKIPNFIEVYIKCPIEICRSRDVKGHYKEFTEGKLKDFVGLDIEYEEPINPDLILETDTTDSKSCANQIIEILIKRGYI